MRNIDPDKFSEALLLTQLYCQQQLLQTHKNHASIFRSINPVYNEKPVFSFTYDKVVAKIPFYTFNTKWERDPYEEGLVTELFNIQLQVKRGAGLIHHNRIFNGGILAYEVGGSVTDGAAAVSSYGFFDDHSCPPIDTWFYLENNVLLAWVPEEVMNFAAEGIGVDPVSCIEWFYNLYPAATAKIEAQSKWSKFIDIFHGLPQYLKR